MTKGETMSLVSAQVEVEWQARSSLGGHPRALAACLAAWREGRQVLEILAHRGRPWRDAVAVFRDTRLRAVALRGDARMESDVMAL
jgi:hypothetical protein